MLSRVRRCVRTPDSFWIYYESLTATLVLQHVERGTIDLAERVVKYLPEFRLTTSGAAEKIRVRHLLDAHERDRRRLVSPEGRGALSIFRDGIGQHCGTSSSQANTSATQMAG
jgi:hypothetical protein